MNWRAFRQVMEREIHAEHREDYIIRLLREIRNNMPSIDDVKAAVNQAASDVTKAITDAVTKETAEVVAQIQAIQPGTTVSQADLDAIVASVQGIGTAATAAVDTISTNDGAVPAPPTPPVVP